MKNKLNPQDGGVRNWTNEVVNTKVEDRGITDYHYLISKGVSKEWREMNHIGNIWINGAVCLLCKDFIRSMNAHDYKSCKCGKISVDGGSWYVKRTSKEGADYINIVENFTNL